MNIVYNDKAEGKIIEWDDLDYGDVCIFQNGSGKKFIGVKVLSEHSGNWVVDLSENPASLYKDGDVYKIVQKFKSSTLTITK